MNFIRGTFRVQGDTIEIFPAAYSERAIRVELFGDEIDRLVEVDALTGEVIAERKHVAVYPASHYVTTKEKMKIARGILICGTGIGVSIAANKVPGAYAALVNNVYQAQRAQLSNNANIITLGAQVTGLELAKCLVKEYLSVTFDPESRSMPKVARITEYEKEGK